MRKHMIHKMTAIAILATSSLVGCGGGGGSSGTTTKTGYFIDSAVEGLEYTSGSTTGITDADGSFKYEEGKPVTFKIGSMVLGSVTVTNNRVFPVDLVSGATDETHPNVSLMARILQTLDSDGVASNGITITDTVRRAITQAIAVASDDPTQTATAISNLLSAATSNRASVLVPTQNAQEHMKVNLLQEYVGTWRGTYTGTDAGTCTMSISLPTGATAATVSGSCTSTQIVNEISTVITSSFNSNGSFSGDLDNQATFIGNFTRAGKMSGTWSNNNIHSGTWSLTKQ
jgi:hypothetical protein